MSVASGIGVLAALEVEGQKHGGPLAAWITTTFLADLAERARTVLALIDVNRLHPFDLLWRRAPSVALAM